MTINIKLAKQLKISDENIRSIESCHRAEEEMIEVMKLVDGVDLYNIRKRWTQLQFYLQRLWGFDEDPRYHKHQLLPKSWHTPGCICPKMDNDDMYPYDIGGYWITQGCPIHTI